MHEARPFGGVRQWLAKRPDVMPPQQVMRNRRAVCEPTSNKGRRHPEAPRLLSEERRGTGSRGRQDISVLGVLATTARDMANAFQVCWSDLARYPPTDPKLDEEVHRQEVRMRKPIDEKTVEAGRE